MEPSGKANFAATSSRSGADGSILFGNTGLCFCFVIGDNGASQKTPNLYGPSLASQSLWSKIEAWSAFSRKKVGFSKSK
jgi:hypothetical protein